MKTITVTDDDATVEARDQMFERWFYAVREPKTNMPYSTLALLGSDDQKLDALQAAFNQGWLARATLDADRQRAVDGGTLVERLRAVEGSGMTHYYRNPDGPEAADRIEALEREKAVLSGEVRRVKGELNGAVDVAQWDHIPASTRLFEVMLRVRAALKAAGHPDYQEPDQ